MGFEPTFLRHDLENVSTFEDQILRRLETSASDYTVTQQRIPKERNQ